MEFIVISQTALLKAIRYCGRKQRKLAELIGESPDKISYWLNRAKQIPFHQAIAIEKVTNGLVSRYDLAPYARIKYKQGCINETHKNVTPLTISDRGYAAIALEKQLGDGRKHLNGRKCASVQGKTSTLVAKNVGFTSRDTYLRVKKILQKGIPDLIQAVDNKTISIARAATVAGFLAEEQQLLLKNEQGHKKKFLTRSKEQKLLAAEQHYQLPLRLPLLGILTYCDDQGQFIWEPQKLKQGLLPYIELDFNAILETLIRIQLIKKIEIDGKIIGKIL